MLSRRKGENFLVLFISASMASSILFDVFLTSLTLTFFFYSGHSRGVEYRIAQKRSKPRRRSAIKSFWGTPDVHGCVCCGRTQACCWVDQVGSWLEEILPDAWVVRSL